MLFCESMGLPLGFDGGGAGCGAICTAGEVVKSLVGTPGLGVAEDRLLRRGLCRVTERFARGGLLCV